MNTTAHGTVVSLDDDPRHAALVAAHFGRIDALMRADVTALARFVRDDLIFVSARGAIQRRPGVVAALQAGTMAIERMDSHDITTRFFGDVGQLIYTANGRIVEGTNVVEGWTHSTTVYVLTGGQWQMVSQHQSLLDAPQ